MASVKDKKRKGSCDFVNHELQSMKKQIHALRINLQAIYGDDSEQFRTNAQHLVELADDIERERYILTSGCAFEWEGMDGLGEDVERAIEQRIPPTDSGKTLEIGFFDRFLGP